MPDRPDLHEPSSKRPVQSFQGCPVRHAWVLLHTLTLSVLLCSAPALAQITTGAVKGKVTDKTGKPLPGVLVTMRNSETGYERGATSNGDGEYAILDLPPAAYVAQATLMEYGAPLQAVVVNLGKTVPVSFVMEPGAGYQETVKVTAESPLLNTTKTEISTVVTEKEIHTFPLINRDFNDLAKFAPGVRQAAGGQFDPTKKPGIYTPFTTGGTAGRNLNISIDGADNNDNVVGFFVQGFSAEAIQEFEVIQDQYKPEYGRSLGGVVNVITKSGSNELHGSIFGQYRNQNTRAMNFSEALNNVPKADSQRRDYGFSLGGPLVKDRLFYFVSAERQGEDNPTTLSPLVTGFSGTEPAGFPFQIATPGTTVSRNLDRDLLSMRIDGTISPTHSFWIRWASDKADFANDQGSAQTDPTNDGSSTNSVWSLVANWQWIVSSHMINELKVHRNHFENTISSSSPDPFLTLSFDALALGRNGNTPQATYQNKSQVRDDFTWIVGRHSLKMGIEAIWVDLPDSNFGPADYSTVAFNFNPGAEPADSMVRGDANGNGVDDGIEVLASVTLQSPQLNPGTKYQQYATYFQDDWSLNSLWHLELGLRVDRDQGIFKDAEVGFNKAIYECFADPDNAHKCGLDPATPNPSNGPRGFPSFHKTFPGDQTNIAPRLGFVYSVKGESRDVIRGSWGLFYDKLLDNWVVFMRQNLSSFHSPSLPSLQGCNITTDPTCSSTQLRAGTTPVAGYAPLPADFTLANWEDPSSGLKAWELGLTSIQGPGTFNDAVAMPSPDWRTPYTSSFSVGWGHSFSTHLVLDTNVVYRRGYRQVVNPAFAGLNSGRDAPFPVVVDAAGTASYPGFVFLLTSEGKSRYESLQTSLRGRYRNFDFAANLNLSRAEGTQDTGTTYSTGGAADIFQGGNIKFSGGSIDSEWGQLSGDQLLYVFLYGDYRFPHGFESAAEMAYGSHTAFNGYAGVDLNGDGFISNEEYAGRRGSGRGDDLFNVNWRGSKRFNTGGGSSLELFVEVFNVLNRVNYSIFVDHRQLDQMNGGNVPNPNYETPTGDTITPPRTVQVGFRSAF